MTQSKEKVYFIPVSENTDEQTIAGSLKELVLSQGIFDYIDRNDFTAIKTHFGENKDLGFVKPSVFKSLGEIIKEKEARPFFTETATLYKGKRSDAVNHITLAHDHGFGFDQTGLPIIMADGLLGDEEVEVDIPGKIYSRVKIASLIVKCQSMVMVSHFTGHMIAGFGAALKNMGMGCASRRGKMEQHSTMKPKIKARPCTRCGTCIEWCPENAITMEEKSAVINKEICIGCGECLAVCRFDAVAYNWGATHEDIQKKIVEHAWGVAKANEGKIAYINFLTGISKDCDCMDKSASIAPDIGILVSRDPVAIDAASLDLVEEKSGKNLSDAAYDIPYKFQIDYARELGFGNPDYELVEV
ncbi:MAG: DUF362 domain-containing protein [bacterium]|nr:DUF362 domain-containing protein [bacterium]